MTAAVDWTAYVLTHIVVLRYVTEDPILHYSMVMPSRHGCPVPVSQMPINIGSGGNSKSSLFGMFLVPLSCPAYVCSLPSSSCICRLSCQRHSCLIEQIMGLLVYCCAGAWYKRERLGAQVTPSDPDTVHPLAAQSDWCYAIGHRDDPSHRRYVCYGGMHQGTVRGRGGWHV